MKQTIFGGLTLILLAVLAAGCPSASGPTGPSNTPTITPTRTITLSPTVTHTLTAVPQPTSTLCIGFGTSEDGTYLGGVGGRANRLAQHVLSSTSAVTAVSFPLHLEGTIDFASARAAVYSDNGGSPDVRLTQSALFNGPLVEGWNTIPVTQVVLSPGTYWLGASVNIDGTNYNFMNTSASPGLAASGNWTSDAPDPFTGGFSSANAWAFKALCGPIPTATLTPTPTRTETPSPTQTSTVTSTPTFWPTPVETNSWTTGNTVGGLVISGSDLYLGSYNQNLVLKRSLGGTPDGSWTSPAVPQPVALHLDGSGNLWAAGNVADTIKVFNAQATPIATLGVPSHYLGMTDNGPTTVLVNDFDNNYVQSYTLAGGLVDQWGTSGLNWGLERDGSLLYLVAYINPLLKLYNLNGTSAGASWPTAGTGRAVAVDSNHRVYVAGVNTPINRYSQTGVLETQWGNYNCMGLAVDANDNLYVSDLNYGIRVFSP